MQLSEVLNEFYKQLNKAMPGLSSKIFIRAEEISNNTSRIFCQLTTSVPDIEKDEANKAIASVADNLGVKVRIREAHM